MMILSKLTTYIKKKKKKEKEIGHGSLCKIQNIQNNFFVAKKKDFFFKADYYHCQHAKPQISKPDSALGPSSTA